MCAMKWIETLNSTEVEEIESFTRDWAFLHGITLRTPEAPGSSYRARHAPLTIFPSPVKRQLYEEAVALQSDFNLLMFRVACDHDFLKHCLESVIKVDKFMKGLWDIYQHVHEEGAAQPHTLGVFRSDYMMHTPNDHETCLKQVEFNTIAAGMAAFGEEISSYHRFLLSKYLDVFNDECLDKRIPPNVPIEGIAKSLVEAWHLFGDESAVILFLVEVESLNIFDQRQLEVHVYRLNPRIKIIRRHFRQVYDNATLKSNKDLVVEGKNVAVTYFRSGYSPKCLPTEKEWAARLLIERSSCIKCPSINVHLAGAKKVQQELCKSGVVERYLKDADAAARIRATFMGQFSLEMNTVGDQTVSMALATPENYVLKPQREGGGYNLYGKGMVPLLTDIQHSVERSAYILMELIRPLVVKNVLVKSGLPATLGDVVGELGVFGVLLASEEKVIENRFVGHFVRTKFSGVTEGGVSVGAACIDSPLLVD